MAPKPYAPRTLARRTSAVKMPWLSLEPRFMTNSLPTLNYAPINRLGRSPWVRLCLAFAIISAVLDAIVYYYCCKYDGYEIESDGECAMAFLMLFLVFLSLSMTA